MDNTHRETEFNPSAVIFGLNNCVFDYATQVDDPITMTRRIRCTNINDDQSVYVIMNNPVYIRNKSNNSVYRIAAYIDDIRLETIPNQSFNEEIVFEGLTNVPKYSNSNGDQRFSVVGFQNISVNKIGQPGMPEGESQEESMVSEIEMLGQPDPTRACSQFMLQIAHFNDPSLVLNSRFKLYINDKYRGMVTNDYSFLTSNSQAMEMAKVFFLVAGLFEYNSLDASEFKKAFKIKLVKTVQMPSVDKYGLKFTISNYDLPMNTSLTIAYNNRIWKTKKFSDITTIFGGNGLCVSDFETDIELWLEQENPREESLEHINYIGIDIGHYQYGSEKLPNGGTDGFSILYKLEYWGPNTKKFVIKKSDLAKFANLIAFSTDGGSDASVLLEKDYTFE